MSTPTSLVKLSAEAIWDQCLVCLKSEVSRSVYETFLAGTRGVSYAGNVFTVSTPAVYVATHLSNHMAFLIEKCLQIVLGHPILLRLQPPAGPPVEIIADAGDRSNYTRLRCPVCNGSMRTEGWRSWHLNKYHPKYHESISPASAGPQYTPEEV